MFQKEAKIKRTVQQIEDRIGIEVVANFAALNRLLQQFARFRSPGAKKRALRFLVTVEQLRSG